MTVDPAFSRAQEPGSGAENAHNFYRNKSMLYEIYFLKGIKFFNGNWIFESCQKMKWKIKHSIFTKNINSPVDESNSRNTMFIDLKPVDNYYVLAN